MGRLVKLAKNAIQVYEEQGSSKRALNYIAKCIVRKGPGAAARLLRPKQVSASKRSAQEVGALEVAVLAAGGVGDLVVIARYLRDLRNSVGPFDFDLFSPQPVISEWVFRNVPGVRQHFIDTDFSKNFPAYELSLFLSSFVQVRQNQMPTGTDSTRSRMHTALHNVAAFSKTIQPYVEAHPRLDNFLTQTLQFRNITRAESLHAMSGTAYGGHILGLAGNPTSLVKFNLNSSLYVTVHNGFETQNITSGLASTKCYPHFGEVVTSLRHQFPDLRFVQLGSRNSTLIDSADVNLVGKTTLEEASTLISEAVCHLDNESGLVHIASCHGTPCCVVFGPTPADYFAYPDNVSVRPSVCGNCWWITANWMDRCPRGFDQPVCTYSQPPSTVSKVASRLINEALESRLSLVAHHLERSR